MTKDSSLVRIPPQAIELENALLGAILLECDTINDVADLIDPRYFYDSRNEYISKAILSLYNAGNPIDILTVTNEMRRKGVLELGGGPAYITDLITRVNSTKNAEFHASIVRDKYLKRSIIDISDKIRLSAYDDSDDADTILSEAEFLLSKVEKESVSSKEMDVRSGLSELYKNLEELSKKDIKVVGVPTGFTRLDRKLGGLNKPDLIIIAGRPGMGKTALGINIARNAAVDFGRKVGILSMEMATIQLIMRLASGETNISTERLRTGNIDEGEFKMFIENTARLAESGIYIDDTPALSGSQLRAKAKRMVAKHGVELLIIDYLQLMRGNGKNREEIIADISRSLKQIAKELDIPVVALSQLNRSVETRGGDKRPQLSDLRESGSIEQDADIVIFPFRPGYYGMDENFFGETEIIIAKNRNGGTGHTLLRWKPEQTMFVEPSVLDLQSVKNG